MVQNITVTPGTGATVAADLVGSALMQQVKINLGATNTDGGLVSTTNPLPIVAEAGTNTIGRVNFDNSKWVQGQTTTRPTGALTYAFGQLIATSAAAGSVVFKTITVASANNDPLVITRGSLLKSSTTISNSIFYIHLFRFLPTVTNGDGAAFIPSVTDGSGNIIYLGAISIPTMIQGSDGAIGIGVPVAGTDMRNTPVSGNETLYYCIEARGAYAAAASEVFTPALELATY